MLYALVRNILSKQGPSLVVTGLVLFGLFLSKLYNYLLFHTLVELSSVITFFIIFVLFWHSRRLLDNRYLTVIGNASLFAGILDLLHTLAYKGMGIFPGSDANLPTQLWIAFRYLVSLSFVAAPLLLRRPVSNRTILIFYAAFTSALLWAVFGGYFPDCFVEGQGLTFFKVVSEYIIALIFLSGLVLLIREREMFDRRVFWSLAAAIIFSVVAELCFTQYVSVYGQANMIGHFFLLGSVAFIYRAVVVTGVAEPAALLFRNLKLSEERIRESEERYRTLVEVSPDVIAVHCEGRYVYMNPAGLKFYGAVHAEDITGKSVLDLVHPESREMVRERMRRSYDEKIASPLREVKVLRLDGSLVEAETVSTPISYLGKPASQMILRDITERKRAEREIEHLASFPRLNPNPVIELNAEGITYLNKAAETILATHGIDQNILIPDELRRRLESLGQGTGVDLFCYETSVLNRTYAENIYLSHPLRVARIYALDITAQKEVEAELLKTKENLEQRVRERTEDLVKTIETLHSEIAMRGHAEKELLRAKEKLQSTLESIRDAFFTVDREWRLTYANTEATRLFRKEREELIGRNIWTVSPEVGTLFRQQYEKVMAERVPVLFDAPSHLLGSWTEVRVYPLEDGISVFIHDISERKETEQRIRVTNDLLKLFARKFSLKEYLDAVVELIRAWSGCAKVGIRVALDSGHVPYAASGGFSEQFLRSESMLQVGTHQCACTRVIAGTPTPQDRPVTTLNGSFYSNNIKRFLQELDTAGQACFRGACVSSGFLSLGVIPLRYRDKILGALQIADERENMLPLENVEFLERMAFIIGEAVFRFEIEGKLQMNYQALRTSEARYRSLVDDVRDIIFTVRPDGILATLSPAFESLTGFSSREWIGRHFTDLIHPEDVPSAKEIFGKIFEKKTIPLFELRGLSANGGYRHLEFKITSVRQEEGMTLGIARDITERKRAEEDRARLVSAVEAAAEAVVITSPSTGVIEYVNPAFGQMTGYTKEESIGQTLHFLESGKHDEVYYAGLRERLGEEGVWNGKLVNRKKDGTEYFEECTVSPVMNGSGEIMNYVYLKRDVTEKMRLQSIAEAVNTMNNIGYVFSGISHEIGNPLTSLIVNLEVLKEKLSVSDETLAGYLDRAMSQVAKIEFLLNSLRSFNLFEVQALKEMQVGPFIDQFLSLVSQDFRKKGIAVEVFHDDQVRSVQSDPRALQQVLLNIFTNASDALENRSCPKITVRTSRSSGFIHICIEDNGCGMTKEQQEKLFKPFHTNKSHGTGLGMVIIRNMLAKMGGTIEVESRRDAGTSVAITIPEDDNGKQ